MRTSTSTKNLPVAITSGDHRGIGPEVIAKGLYRLRSKLKPHEVVIFGLPRLYAPYKKFLPKIWAEWTEKAVEASDWTPTQKTLNFIIPRADHIANDKRDAFLCGRYVELATLWSAANKFAAVCTGPVNKNELHKGGYPYDGHTELLKDLCHAPSVTMMMAGPKMRVSLVTVHEALSQVSKKLSVDKIVTTLENTHSGLIRDFGVKKPRIAVLGLNPHAGDSGLFGDEETQIISPAIESAKSRLSTGRIEGPFPPDGFFALWNSRHSKNFDAVVCMYHDQGLIPVKLLDFENTVNVSLGLPIVRTSVDHGVGYDIFGKNKADPSSFCAALSLALQIVRKRK